jgi:hypothetical protein
MEENAPCNDETETWITLKAATLNLVRWLEFNEQQTEHSERKDAENDDDPKRDVKQPERTGEYVEHRLRELREFERRASGKK